MASKDLGNLKQTIISYMTVIPDDEIEI